MLTTVILVSAICGALNVVRRMLFNYYKLYNAGFNGLNIKSFTKKKYNNKIAYLVHQKCPFVLIIIHS